MFSRFYSKFHKKRMEELSEQGILSFFNLLLTLACVGELEDVVRSLIVFSLRSTDSSVLKQVE